MKNAMKRLGLLLLLLSFLALPPAGAEEARDVLQEGDFRYLLRADGKAQIVGYTGEAESVAIPAALGGAPVAEVAAGAFFYAEELREVIIPEGVTTLQEMAFLDCPGLRRAVLPDSLAEVPGNPFPLCDGLEEVVLSPEHPLLRCTDGCLYAWPEKRLVALLRPWAYTEFAVPEGVETVGSFALYWAVNLERVSLPGSVTRIGDRAFAGCSRLVFISIPDSVTEIANDALYRSGNAVILCSIDSEAAAFAMRNGIPYLTNEEISK